MKNTIEKIKNKIRYGKAKKRIKKLNEEAEKLIYESKLRLRNMLIREKETELQEYICDNICKYPCTCRCEEHLMEVCEECQVEEYLEEIHS